MKYFIDTEFIEGTQKGLFGMTTKPTIDLISIGIVSEDGREYYAISKDFNLKEAWDRCEWKTMNIPKEKNRRLGKTLTLFSASIPRKEYWIRDNVLKPIWLELMDKEYNETSQYGDHSPIYHKDTYNYKNFKRLLNKYGKTNKQIAEEVIEFVNGIGEDISIGFGDKQFYGYYADYDWVVFCWLFGKMNDLPKGFPKYCIDLKQTLDEKANYLQLFYHGGLISKERDRLCTFGEKVELIKNDPNYPKQTNEHNALSDAKWTKSLYEFLNAL